MAALKEVGTGTGTARLGLGCARIASLSTRPGHREIAHLLESAYAAGIRFFDTADVYGQGDSERHLARFAGHPDVVICTKAGLSVGRAEPLIRLAKPILRPMLRRLRPAAHAARTLRQASETNDLRPERLRQRLRRSLRQLDRPRTDIFLLHSPPLEALTGDGLWQLLERFKSEGLAGRTGVSCRSLADAEEIMRRQTPDALEVPLTAETLAQAGPFLDAAAGKGVFVIAREVFPDGPLDAERVAQALAPLLGDRRISVVLTGTTSIDHLRMNVTAAGRILAAGDRVSCS